MAQNTPIRTTGAAWQFQEPAMNPNHARTDNGKLLAAANGQYLVYPKGQILCQKDDGTNVWAKKGTAGYAGPVRILKYAVVVNDAGKYQFGDTWYQNGGDIFEDSVDFYYQGFFFCQDLTGTKDASVGRLVRGSYSVGMLELGAANPVNPA